MASTLPETEMPSPDQWSGSDDDGYRAEISSIISMIECDQEDGSQVDPEWWTHEQLINILNRTGTPALANNKDEPENSAVEDDPK